MCGIAGIVEFRGNEARNNQNILKKMSVIIVTAGPMQTVNGYPMIDNAA